MKIIIKISLILFVVNLYSCSEVDNDPIVGVWQLNQRFSPSGEIELSDCFKQSTFSYNADGTYLETTIVEFGPGDCQIVDEKQASWAKISDNSYELTFVGGAFDGDTVVRDIYFEGDNKLYLEFSISTQGKDRSYYIRL